MQRTIGRINLKFRISGYQKKDEHDIFRILRFLSIICHNVQRIDKYIVMKNLNNGKNQKYNIRIKDIHIFVIYRIHD